MPISASQLLQRVAAIAAAGGPPADPETALTWCDAADMRAVATVVDSIHDADIDGPDFVNVRATTTDRLRLHLVESYRPSPGFFRSRQNAPHPLFGYEVPDPTAPIPAPPQYAALLKSGGLLLDPDVREIVARISVAAMLDRQEEGNYSAAVRAQLAAADLVLARYWPRIDANGDGLVDFAVHPAGVRVTFYPPGTAA